VDKKKAKNQRAKRGLIFWLKLRSRRKKKKGKISFFFFPIPNPRENRKKKFAEKSPKTGFSNSAILKLNFLASVKDAPALSHQPSVKFNLRQGQRSRTSRAKPVYDGGEAPFI